LPDSRQSVLTWIRKLRNLHSRNTTGPTVQARKGKDSEGFTCAAVTVICSVCRSVELLYLTVITIYKCSINPITNSNPVASHYHMTMLITSALLNILVLGIPWPPLWSSGQSFWLTEVLGSIPGPTRYSAK
jgi:hypothetical protein